MNIRKIINSTSLTALACAAQAFHIEFIEPKHCLSADGVFFTPTKSPAPLDRAFGGGVGLDGTYWLFAWHGVPKLACHKAQRLARQFLGVAGPIRSRFGGFGGWAITVRQGVVITAPASGQATKPERPRPKARFTPGAVGACADGS